MDAVRTLAVVCLVLGQTLAECPDNWIAYKESCYLFGSQQEEFVVAEQYCRQHDSHMVHVNDAVENNFIKDWLRRFKPTVWWMGFSDNLVEGNWEWEDTKTASNFTDWGPSQPNDSDGQDCAEFYPNYDFQWNDIDCTLKRYAICEKSRTIITEIVG